MKKFRDQIDDFSIGIPYRSPEIAYIIPGSTAANPHVTDGAVWMKYTTMKSKSGEIFAEISFSSGGNYYTFSTKNNLCNKSGIYINKHNFTISVKRGLRLGLNNQTKK